MQTTTEPLTVTILPPPPLHAPRRRARRALSETALHTLCTLVNRGALLAVVRAGDTSAIHDVLLPPGASRGDVEEQRAPIVAAWIRQGARGPLLASVPTPIARVLLRLALAERVARAPLAGLATDEGTPLTIECFKPSPLARCALAVGAARGGDDSDARKAGREEVRQ